ncbi:hypothetical protein [Bacillus sp. FJAT-45350]|uniref:hypothetical protein n=1 Tax=Bacillus sp. FJAT-45350 TaxID=2011014 RepID=UPI0015CCA41F|nr:hypothetical protein [Bacillus sp. FJAT-45350]
MEGFHLLQTVITDGNDSILTIIDKPLSKQDIFVIFGEEEFNQLLSMMLPWEY